MSLSYIEKCENALKRGIVVAEQTALNERQRVAAEKKRAVAEKQRADDAVEILKEIVDNNDIKLYQKTMNRISCR